MKYLYRFIIITIFWNLSAGAEAQEFKLKTGFNMSTMSVEAFETAPPADITAKTYQIKPGFHVGGLINMHVTRTIDIESAILFNSRGVRIASEETGASSDITNSINRNLYYLDLLLRAKVPFRMKLINFFISGGPYMGYGLFGQDINKTDYGSSFKTNVTNINWGTESVDDLRNLDYGLSFEAGIELSSYLNAGLMYNLGLENISPTRNEGSKISNSIYGISLSYRFGDGKGPEEKNITSNDIRRKDRVEKASGEKDSKKIISDITNQDQEKVSTENVDAIRIEQERIARAKAVADSIETLKKNAILSEIKLKQSEKTRTDSTLSAQKISEKPADIVVYRVQFASSMTKKGSYNISVGNKTYRTWEYFHNGAYRSTVGEFKTLKEAISFQNSMRNAGIKQAFVVAFKNNVRSTDAALFR